MNNIFVIYFGDDPVISEYLKLYTIELGWNTNIISASTDASVTPAFKADVCLVDLNHTSLENSLIMELLEKTEVKKIFLADSADKELYLRFRKYLPIGYIVRPVSEMQLRSQIETAIVFLDVQRKAGQILQAWKEEEEVQSSFYIKNNNKLLKVKQSDILAVVADGNYCVIITSHRRHAIKISLRRIKIKLSALLFKQIHRNYIVQLPKVESIDLSTNEVCVDGELYPIGGSYRQRFLDHLDRI